MLAYEPFWVAGVGGGQDVGADCVDVVGLSMVDVVWGVPGDAGVAVFGVIPAEETLAEGSGVGERAEGVREVGPVLQRPEMRLRVRVVVALTG